MSNALMPLMAVWVLLTLAPVAAFAGLLDEEGVGSFQLLDENVGLNKKVLELSNPLS